MEILKKPDFVEKILDLDFYNFAYRFKYKIPFNDERILKSSNLQIKMDIILMNEFESKIKQIKKKVQLEEDFGESIDDYTNLDENVTQEEIDNFLNEEDLDVDLTNRNNNG